MSSNLPPNSGKNDTRYEDLLHKARELGVMAGKGKDTLVQFGILMVNAAYDGAIDLSKDKHGSGVDDAAHAYGEYSRAMATGTIFDHRSPSGKVQAAKLRSCIRLGSWTRGGPGEPIQTMNKLLAIRDKLRKDPVQCKGLDDAYNTLLRYARYQVKQNGAIDDEQLLRVFCLKPEAQKATLEEYLKGVSKKLEDLRAGRAAGGSLQHTSVVIDNVISSLRMEVSDIRKGPVTGRGKK
jgi:hypothetical protein